MDKKIIAIISAVALIVALILVASFAACNDNNNPGENDGSNQVDLPGDSSESDDESGNGNTTPSEIGDPGEYSYADCDETVYVNNPGSAVTLRSETYEDCGSIPHGTELKRTGLSTDEANYWSEVVYDGETYYIASKFLTTMSNPDDGFVAVDKTVYLNGDGETGTSYLNVRNLPSMEGSVIGGVSWKSGIKVIAENTTTEWYKIEFVDANGETKIGYIASDAKYYKGTEAGNGATSEATTESTVESDTEGNGTEAAPEGAGK